MRARTCWLARARAPGANGIQLFAERMYVTNSDSATLLRFDVDDRGRLGDPAVVTGVPEDDFAIDDDVTFYLTTHIIDTVVRVDPDGRGAVIASRPEHVSGATVCTLTHDSRGRGKLYVVTDGGGGLVSGDTKALGTLVALTLPVG